MSQPEIAGAEELSFLARLSKTTSRRNFVRWSGLTVAAVAVGCSNDDDNGGMGPGNRTDFGTGDTAVLNYAYALEQLEAAFYTQVVATPYMGITADETTILTDIRDHEVIHRDYLKAALGNDRIEDLSVTFATVDFTSRASVLGAARTFEDLGVSAYNGAGQLLTDAGHLLTAGKIVSVEARHAAAIRDLLNPKSADFAGDDVVSATGLDQENSPSTVLTAADPYITTTITRGDLP